MGERWALVIGRTSVQVRSAVRLICVWKCGNEMQEKLAD